MNFTREPIIETIITPKEGYKLSVRSSKGESEEYLVDAIEVVSFGHSFFFRSSERPKCFLVPVTDYEIVEVKEARVALKNAQVERSIKIGGGREAPVRAQREEKEESVEEASQEGEPGAPSEGRSERRRDRRHRRRRGGRSGEERQQQEGQRWQERAAPQAEEPQQIESETTEQGGGKNDEAQVSSSIFSTLIPPPPTLISETIGRYKDKDTAPSERDILPKPLVEDEAEEEGYKEEKDDEDNDEGGSSGSSGSHLSRVTTTSFSYEGSVSFLGKSPPPFGSSLS